MVFSSFTTAKLEFELAVQEQLSLKVTSAKAVGGGGKETPGDLLMARVARGPSRRRWRPPPAAAHPATSCEGFR